MSKSYPDAVIFDLDGVITQTAVVHSTAWKTMFDAYLHELSRKTGRPLPCFDHQRDYLPYIDGQPRYQGVQSFLASRDIDLPMGTPQDPPTAETICGLGNRKNELFKELIHRHGVEVYPSSRSLIEQLANAGIAIGVASSSKSCAQILQLTNMDHFFQVRIDGEIAALSGLKGKPAPDIFTTACDQLGVAYDRAVVIEDAASGVEAGVAGGFALVIGVARSNNKRELQAHGADIVVSDLGELDLDKLANWLESALTRKQWGLSYHRYHPETEKTTEALLTVGNGYLGVRGAMEEMPAGPFHYPATYLAGVYNTLQSTISGRSVSNEDLVNVPNWLSLSFQIDGGDWLDIDQMTVLECQRYLDFRSGIYQRRLHIKDQQGRETLIVSRRCASMADCHLLALQYTLVAINYCGRITVRSCLDGNVANQGVERYRQLNSHHLQPQQADAAGEFSWLTVSTSQSAIKIAQAARLEVRCRGQALLPEFASQVHCRQVTTSFAVDLAPEQALCVEKTVLVYTSRDAGVDDPLPVAKSRVSALPDFEAIAAASAVKWQELWEKMDIALSGDLLSQKLLRLHCYHLLVTASPHNIGIDAGMPARGLHGEGYRGHIFWDELFILPFYHRHFPEISRAALAYRYRRLDKAREAAASAGYRGAMFPWQSGSDGSEQTQTLHLNPLSGQWSQDYSRYQRHVSLAIAFNIWEYYRSSGDLDFLERYGAEIFLEICRFFAAKACLQPQSGRYAIDEVMGPDEFHEKYATGDGNGIKNNAYTNIMAVWAWCQAPRIWQLLSQGRRQELGDKIGIDSEEIQGWSELAARIEVTISAAGIIEQFAGFFQLADLPWQEYRQRYGDIHRLDRILKKEGRSPDAYQVAKQADVLMLFYNFGPRQLREIFQRLDLPLAAEALAKNFDYYYQRTSHGSTLSKVVHSYLATQINERRLGFELFQQALRSDYDDVQGGTTAEGIHCGVMAATLSLALESYAGIDIRGEMLTIAPSLPRRWRQITTAVSFSQIRYWLQISPTTVNIKAEKDSQVIVAGQRRCLSAGNWHQFSYPQQEKPL